MRLAVLASVFLARIASADTPGEHADVTVGAGVEQIGTSTESSVSASAQASDVEVSNDAIAAFAVDSSAELRGGSDGVDGTAMLGARMGGAYLGVPDRPYLAAFGTLGLGTRPGLDARRDVGRAGYASAGGGFDLGLAVHHGNRVTGIGFVDIEGSVEDQRAAQRATFIFEMEMFYRCRLRPDARSRCLHVLDFANTGVSGGTQAVVSNVSFVRWTGLDLGAAWGDIGFGIITDNATLATEDGKGHVVATVKTEDLPIIQVGAYDLGLATMGGPLEVDARAKRSGYVSLDGDMSIEDRVSLSAVLPLAPHAKLTASAFLARTHWWTSKTDPGSAASTGGGELALDLRVHAFDVHAAGGIARSFYAVLDGGAAPEQPSLGFRSGLDVKHSIRNWTP